MATREPRAMIVFDFSGTLSLAATEYGRSDYLLRELRESGLSRVGIDSVAQYWSEIVNPTWAECSTTTKGLIGAIVERLSRLRDAGLSQASDEEIQAAAASFATSYFGHSTIAPMWKPVLKELVDRSDVLTVIATDHYAEATTCILSQLESLSLVGIPATQPWTPGVILVANSADLGYHKADAGFWERLKQAQGVHAFSLVGVVEDFGSNEQPEDAYAQAERVRQRQEKTQALLASAFSAEVHVFPFMVEREARQRFMADGAASAEALARLVEEARSFLGRLLADQ